MVDVHGEVIYHDEVFGLEEEMLVGLLYPAQ
jgi:hypothetical protein